MPEGLRIKARLPCSDFQVADSEAIKLPTLKEVIGYPTTYDLIDATTPLSVLLHMLHFDVDNDISQQNVERSYPSNDLTSANSENGFAQPLREAAEEIGDSWLRQASETKASSPTTKDVILGERASVTNAIQDETETSTSISNPRPTTMRGTFLASSTPSAVMRGFYITRTSENLPPSSTWTSDLTSIYSLAMGMETSTLAPDVESASDETVAVARDDQGESEPGANDVINDEEKLSTLTISTTSGEIISDDKEFDIIKNSTSEGEKYSSENVDRDATASLADVRVVSPTARRAIALAVSRYNEFITPVWTGRRIVVRKRNRTAASPIEDVVGRVRIPARATESAFGISPSTPVTRESVEISTIPTTLSPESTIPFEISSDLELSDSANPADGRTEDSQTSAIAEATATTATATPTVNDPPVVSTISDDPATVTISATVLSNAAVTTDAPTPAVDDSAVATTATENVEVDTTVASTSYTVDAIESNPASTSDGIEVTPAITSRPVAATSATVNAYEWEADFTVAVAPETASNEIVSTTTNYSAIMNTRETTISAASLPTSLHSVADTLANATAPATIGDVFAEVDAATTSAINTAMPTAVISPVDSADATTTFASVPFATTPATSSGVSTADAISPTVPNFLANESSIPVAISSTSDVEALTIPTAESVETTEVPANSEASLTSVSTTTAIPRSLPVTTVASTASSVQIDEASITTNSEASWSSLSITIPDNVETVALEKSMVVPTTLATSYESSAISRTTASTIYETDSIRTTSEESAGVPADERPESRTEFTGAIASVKRTRAKGRTTSKLDAVDRVGQRTSGRIAVHRRVISRPSDSTKRPATRRPIGQYPRRRVTVYRGRPRGPSHTSSSRTIEQNHRRRISQKRLRLNSEATSSTVRPDEKAEGRMKIVSKRVRERVGGKEVADPAKNGTLEAHREDGKTGRRRVLVVKKIKSRHEENFVNGETNSTDFRDKNLSNESQSDHRASEAKLPEETKSRRRMKVVRLKRVRLKTEDKNVASEKTNVASDFIDGSLSRNFSRHRADKNLPEGGSRRIMRVVLKSVRPRSEGENAATEEANDSTGEDLEGNFSNNLYVSDDSSDGGEVRGKMRIVFEEVRRKLKGTEKAKKASTSPVDENLRGDFSSNFHANGGDPFDAERTMRPEEGEATTEPREELDAEYGLRTTETSVWIEGDTDRPSNEVSPSKSAVGSANRRSSVGHSIRQRRPKTPHSTTTIPPIYVLPSTSVTHRRGRPAETTLLPRIDFVGAFEGTEAYVKSVDIEDDQRADDQSIRAQQFAVTLADPPAASSATGYAPLRDDVGRKISTTVAPRIDPIATIGTISRYDNGYNDRRRIGTKNRPPAANATTRPRRPRPIIDYDYYDNEAPIVVSSSFLNSKLFLTSKGTIHCLDQGNFPHPYSCKKFITCARMVNGRVIGTEYTCPDRLSFDPIGGICNWSAGLGCKD